MRAERERAEAAADLHDARGRLARARAALAGPLGLDPRGLTTVASLEPRALLPTMEEARLQAGQRGDVLAFRAQVEQQELLARAAGRRWIPEPTVVAGRKTSEAGGVQDSGPLVGVSVAVPLFDRAQGARATAQAEAMLLRARQAALESRLSAEAAAAVEEAEARRHAETEYGGPADPEELVRIARGAYEEGETRILELLDAYRTALAARLRLIELRAEARRAEIAVDMATGVERLP
jgi:cobalt-zinc-cadmium efflux system outer membrane protein